MKEKRLQVRLDPMGMICGVVYAFVVGYMVGKLSQVSHERRKREAEELRERMNTLEFEVFVKKSPTPEPASEPADKTAK